MSTRLASRQVGGAVVMASLLVGCGGSESSAGSGDAGSDVDATATGADADRSADASEDGDAPCVPGCPAQEPVAGTACTTSCVYGVDAAAGCARYSDCASGRFQAVQARCIAPPPDAGCPASPSDIPAGGTCDPGAPRADTQGRFASACTPTPPSTPRTGGSASRLTRIARRCRPSRAAPVRHPVTPAVTARTRALRVASGSLSATAARGGSWGRRRASDRRTRLRRAGEQRLWWPMDVSSVTLLAMAAPRTLTVSVELPLSAGDGASPDPTAVGDELRLLWIIEQVRLQRIGVGKGAELARLPRAAFMQALGAHGVPVIDYAPADLQRELDAQDAV